MEMELGSVEVSFWNVLVEQADRARLEVVEAIVGISGLLTLLQGEGVRLNGLVELVGGLWINGFVVELETRVLEIFKDWHVGLEIDWGALNHVDGLVLVVAFTWSLSNWVSPVLGVVIHVGVLMLSTAVWYTEFFMDCRVVLVTLFKFGGTKFHKVNSILEYSILFHLVESFFLDSGLGELALAHGSHTFDSLELTLVLLIVLSLPFFIFHVFQNFLLNKATIDSLHLCSVNSSLICLFLIFV